LREAARETRRELLESHHLHTVLASTRRFQADEPGRKPPVRDKGFTPVH